MAFRSTISWRQRNVFVSDPTMERPARILVSSCLLGRPVRYDGSSKIFNHSTIEQWGAEGRLVPICPEILGGFPTPRPPAEIENAEVGASVLDGKARVVEETGLDVTLGFVEGAKRVLEIALEQRCKFALLTDGSPSCGSSFVYDGAFSGRKHKGDGGTTALLRRNGIDVFSPHQIEALALAAAAYDRRIND